MELSNNRTKVYNHVRGGDSMRLSSYAFTPEQLVEWRTTEGTVIARSHFDGSTVITHVSVGHGLVPIFTTIVMADGNTDMTTAVNRVSTMSIEKAMALHEEHAAPIMSRLEALRTVPHGAPSLNEGAL